MISCYFSPQFDSVRLQITCLIRFRLDVVRLSSFILRMNDGAFVKFSAAAFNIAWKLAKRVRVCSVASACFGEERVVRFFFSSFFSELSSQIASKSILKFSHHSVIVAWFNSIRKMAGKLRQGLATFIQCMQLWSRQGENLCAFHFFFPSIFHCNVRSQHRAPTSMSFSDWWFQKLYSFIKICHHRRHTH